MRENKPQDHQPPGTVQCSVQPVTRTEHHRCSFQKNFRCVPTPASTWDEAKQSLLGSATARGPAGPLLRYHEACNDVWQDLWSQHNEDDYVPSQLILGLMCSRRGEKAPVCVPQRASVPLCWSCQKRAGRGWPKARWALRHLGQLSWSAWEAIQCDLRSVQVDGVQCLVDETEALSLLWWRAALNGDSQVLWPWHHRGVL